MPSLLKCFSAAFAALFAFPLIAKPLQWPEDGWELKRDRDGIQVYTRAMEGSAYRAVKAVGEIDASPAQLTALVKDTEACPRWADLCKTSFVHQSESAQREWVYTHNDLPWPVTDRDVLAEVNWHYLADRQAVVMDSAATSDIYPKQKGRVRIQDARASWVFEDLGAGKSRVTSFGHIDPAGPTPAWMTNLLLVDSPFNTLKRMAEAVEDEAYQNASFDFIQ